ncbi:hypothetical protein HYU72_00830 [Candidatus Berkelbacteria bacterium]|nr:hypothetical protein [Candidatus Berkelbacteria bacterium]
MTGYTTQGDLVIVDGHIVVVVVERSTDDEGEVTRVFGHLCPATDVGHGSFLDDVFMDETEGPVTWGEIRKLFHQWLSYEIDWWNAETALREHPSDKQVKRILAALEPKVTALLAEVFPPAPADDLVWVGERRLYRLVAGCVAEYPVGS